LEIAQKILLCSCYQLAYNLGNFALILLFLKCWKFQKKMIRITKACEEKYWTLKEYIFFEIKLSK
jgi:hypothetical protein